MTNRDTLPCPLVVIPGVTTDIDLGVNPARTAKHLAPRLEQRTTVHVTLWLGIELPVETATEHQLQNPSGVLTKGLRRLSGPASSSNTE